MHVSSNFWHMHFGIILLTCSNVSPCFFRKTWMVPDNASDGLSNPVKLDKETLSIIQQTFVKTLLSLGKLRFHCPRESGAFADTLDCRKYYTCSNYTFIEQYCSNTTGFEPMVQSCVSEESVPLCKRVQKLHEHACNDTGVHTYEGHCDKFLLCTEDATYVSTCNTGDVFDQTLKLCLPETEANCTNTTEEKNNSLDDVGLSNDII